MFLSAVKIGVKRIRRRLGGRDIRVEVHGASLLLPWDHALPRYSAQFPMYSSNVIRVAQAVERKYPAATLIDVGANVGDTSAFWRQQVACPILAVEGDAHWRKYLEANAGGLPQVSLAEAFLTAGEGAVELTPRRSDGTTTFTSGQRPAGMTATTPTQLLQAHPAFRQSHLVKTDTDGYDYDIVVGFLEAGMNSHPVFFVEHDPNFPSPTSSTHDVMFAKLADHGYSRVLWWDNFGHYLTSGLVSDKRVWNDLTQFVTGPRSIYYWDVAFFHSVDEDLAVALARGEADQTDDSPGAGLGTPGRLKRGNWLQ